MLDILYDLPDQPGTSYVVTEEVVSGQKPLFGMKQRVRRVAGLAAFSFQYEQATTKSLKTGKPKPENSSLIN